MIYLLLYDHGGKTWVTWNLMIDVSAELYVSCPKLSCKYHMLYIWHEGVELEMINWGALVFVSL